jgi:hypothetical protein
VGKAFIPEGKAFIPEGKAFLPVGKAFFLVGKAFFLVGKAFFLVGKAFPRKRKTVARALPNQMRVRMSRRREIKSVGCILPRMFLVREGKKLAFHHVQNQSGKGIFHPFLFHYAKPQRKGEPQLFFY